MRRTCGSSSFELDSLVKLVGQQKKTMLLHLKVSGFCHLARIVALSLNRRVVVVGATHGFSSAGYGGLICAFLNPTSPRMS